MFEAAIIEIMKTGTPAMKQSALRKRVISLMADPSISVTERLDRIEQAFELFGWRRPTGCHDEDEFYKE